MYGGKISGNTVENYGSGVIVKNSTFNMYGGAISDNKADYGGGGVYVSEGAFNMQGGSISGNNAEENGGGVYMDSNISVSGNASVTGNTIGEGVDTSAANVYLTSGKNITIGDDDGLTENASIGVTTAEDNSIFTTDWDKYMSGKTPSDYSTPDKSDYVVVKSSDGIVTGTNKRLFLFSITLSSVSISLSFVKGFVK